VSGKMEGNGDSTMDAGVRVNRAVKPSCGLTQSSSHTLESRDSERTQALRDRFIDATVEAIAGGSGPRLVQSRFGCKTA
jgi:hypothetical protein